MSSGAGRIRRGLGTPGGRARTPPSRELPDARAIIEVRLGDTWYSADLIECLTDPDGWAARVCITIDGVASYEALVASDLIRTVPDPLPEPR